MMRRTTVLKGLLTAGLLLLMAAFSSAAPQASGDRPLPTAEASSPRRVRSPEPPLPAERGLRDYAAREAQSRDLESFTGGHEVEIVVSGCAIVVLVLVLCILFF